ncbi:MAG: xanthine dehydrogenase accessory protein XdhC [Treponema sp.]|nr:xanthine dehydrogenase accessory protein XdhC [Treponema sp.]
MLEKINSGEDTVLATIVADTGSSPRSAGAHILVDKNGRVCGTIGGGTLEYKSIQLARNLLEQRQSRRKTYRLYRNDEEELGMLCGGNVDVFFQFIKGGDEKTACLVGECIARLGKDEDLWLFIDLTSPTDWTMALYSGGSLFPGEMKLGEDDIKDLARNKEVLVRKGDRRIYGEPVNFAGKVFIFGGGHVAQALAPVLNSVGFRCVVFDNREEFVSRELFPNALDLITGDYDHVEEKLTVDSRDYIVIVTHAYDLTVLRQIIGKNCAYIGVIGSKTKAAALKQQLARERVSEETLAKINTPIGLKIKSETPEEIAVSIAGEMILRRAERRAAALTPADDPAVVRD